MMRPFNSVSYRTQGCIPADMHVNEIGVILIGGGLYPVSMAKLYSLEVLIKVILTMALTHTLQHAHLVAQCFDGSYHFRQEVCL